MVEAANEDGPAWHAADGTEEDAATKQTCFAEATSGAVLA